MIARPRNNIFAEANPDCANLLDIESRTFSRAYPYLPNNATMKVGKPQSKRVPVRLRHKIQKASSAKQKKERRDSKKNPQWRSRLKKDPGIPNLFPYKAKMLAEIEENKRKKEEELQRRRDVAKGQRQGVAVPAVQPDVVGVAEVEDDVLLDVENNSEADLVDDIMDEREESNPMAALLASAEARAQAYTQDDENYESGDQHEEEEWEGIDDSKHRRSEPTQKALPKTVLADPVKAVSALLDRMRQTTDGIQRLMNHYQLPPLMTANTDLTSGFLVEVARKRGRLGRGGVPNLHSAALTVLSDLNEERLGLPSAVTVTARKASSTQENGGVQIVSQLAQPFRIEGLWGEDVENGGVVT